MDRFGWITRDGYERLQAELSELTAVRRPDVAAWLRQAREDGGEPGANAGLMEALEEHAAVERRISELERTLGACRVAESVAPGVAGIGSFVHVDGADGRRSVFQLVGAAEVDASRGRVSADSPVGRALTGARAGDTMEVDVPAGRRVLTVVAVEESAAPRLSAARR
jgi:transcription elongation factor GreA